jgi:phosphoribosyl 1,2-cyclic phosphate phosphodiesterase
LKLTFLGTGTSFGIPVVGCDCATCRSDDPRDRRTRNGALIELPDGVLLIDAPPELRLQLVREGVGSVDAVWFTHLHADHVHGIDDLRVFSARRGEPLLTYVPEEYVKDLQGRFPYIFDPTVLPPAGTTKPEMHLKPIRSHGPVRILGADVHPLAVPHGSTLVYGFRVGGLGYITDGKRLPPDVVSVLDGVDVLVINALWWGSPHPTHFNIEEALDAARSVRARRTYLIHMTHRLRHAELERRLPADVEPAYDGLTVEI